jgi:hypothetical protein
MTQGTHNKRSDGVLSQCGKSFLKSGLLATLTYKLVNFVIHIFIRYNLVALVLFMSSPLSFVSNPFLTYV